MSVRKLREYLAWQRRSAPAISAARALSIADLYDSQAMAASADPALSRYMNVGYWYPDTKTPDEAGENLMERLVAGLCQRSTRDMVADQRVLDVACGLGATTRYLTRHWHSTNIWGINITTTQLSMCQRVAPGCHFERMSATQLRFEPDFFDFILCAEAAFQFRSRGRFLQEAHRVLKPGGALALSDLLVIPESYEIPHRFSDHHPRENACASPAVYREQVLAAGFRECEVIDITEAGYRGYASFCVAGLHAAWSAERISFETFIQSLDAIHLQDCLLNHVVLCFATK
jgi:MPBQ/MSBQ methyltransferase